MRFLGLFRRLPLRTKELIVRWAECIDRGDTEGAARVVVALCASS